MTLTELDTFLEKRAKGRYIVVPFIYGFNEDGEPIFTIYDDYVKSFNSIKNTKKQKGFMEYITNLKYEWIEKYPNFSITIFIKIKKYFLPIGEIGVNTETGGR
jgi:hypothetical protein